MITCNAISFEHTRIETVLNGASVETSEVSYGTLPDLAIFSIAVDKQVVKIYYPFGNTSSVYVTLGMVGPTIKLVGHTENITPWNALFANDILTVAAFGFPTWATIMPVGSKWWVDIKSKDTQSGRRMRYEVSLDMVKLSEV
jgi:hypothetical protein